METRTVKLVLQKPPGFKDPRSVTAAPPPPPMRKRPLPQTFRQAGKAPRHRSSSSCCRRLCCFVFIFILCLLFLLALAGAVCYLYFQPRLPSFRLQSLRTPRFNVTTKLDGSENSGTFLDVATVVNIFVANQNGKILLTYGQSSAEVYIEDEDGDISVGSGSMVGFVQEKKNGTMMKFAAETKGLLVDDAVGSRLRERGRRREVRFGVEVMMGIGIGVGSGTMTRRVPVKVGCQPVSLKQFKTGRKMPNCDVYLFRGIKLH